MSAKSAKCQKRTVLKPVSAQIYDFDFGSTTTQNPWASRVSCMISKNVQSRGSHHDDGF